MCRRRGYLPRRWRLHRGSAVVRSRLDDFVDVEPDCVRISRVARPETGEFSISPGELGDLGDHCPARHRQLSARLRSQVGVGDRWCGWTTLGARYLADMAGRGFRGARLQSESCNDGGKCDAFHARILSVGEWSTIAASFSQTPGPTDERLTTKTRITWLWRSVASTGRQRDFIAPPIRRPGFLSPLA